MGQWKHRLSDRDIVNRTAICSHCGPVRIKPKKGGRYWACLVAENASQVGRQRGEHRKYVADSCDRCGFIPEDVCQLDVHHLDENHSNNDPENLLTLCANCHRLRHKKHRRP